MILNLIFLFLLLNIKLNKIDLKKNILFVIDSLGCGGAEKSLISLLPLLDYNKYNIDIMMISRGGLFEKYIPNEVSIIDYISHKKGLIGSFIYLIFQLIFSVKLRIYQLFKIKKHGAEVLWDTMKYAIKQHSKRYDIAVAYQQGFPTYYVASKINAQKKIAWINADITKVGYRKKFNTKFYLKYNYIVTVSNKLREIFNSSYNLDDKTKVVCDVINHELVINLSNQSIIRHHNKKLIITTVGRLVPPKGHFLAINAARILKEESIDFVWYFIGNGPMRIEIEQLIKENNLTEQVNLLGEQSNPYPYIKSCDIYVQPSLSEGFGLTIAEAKILQKPIVCTNFDVAYDQITNEINGLIVNKTGREIANAILRLINDDGLKESLIINLKQEVNKTMITEPAKVMALFEE